MEYESKTYGWFQTLEFPPSTAKLVQADKAVNYATKLKPLPNGNCVVLYRGYTDQEKAANNS